MQYGSAVILFIDYSVNCKDCHLLQRESEPLPKRWSEQSMETILDTGSCWFLERALYPDILKIYVVEGVLSSEPQKLNISGVDLGTAYATVITEASRRYLVSFENVLAYQITRESLTRGEDNVTATGTLRAYERSDYLDFVRSSTLVDAIGPETYTHFSLVLVDDVVDVIAGKEPSIEQMAGPPTDT